MNIEIFGKETCVWCDRARVLCEQYELEYTYKALDDRFYGEENTSEFRGRAPAAKTVPQIFVDGKLVGGFNDFATKLENENVGNFGQGDF
jgi:glutaredoxin